MHEIAHYKDKIPGFPYQLLEWQPKLEDLNSALSQFKKHRCENKAIIVKSPKGYAIFTTGELMTLSRDIHRENVRSVYA